MELYAGAKDLQVNPTLSVKRLQGAANGAGVHVQLPRNLPHPNVHLTLPKGVEGA